LLELGSIHLTMRQFAVLVYLLLPVAAAAQSNGELAVYHAAMLTPVSGLPALMTSSISGQVQRSAQFGVRYGYLSQERRDALVARGDVDVNNFAFTGVLPMSLGSTISLTGGVSSPACDDCDPGLMLSVAGDMRITEVPFGSTEDAARLTITINGELGFGKPKLPLRILSTAWAGAVGVPIGLISGGRNAGMRIVPFITPALAFGTTDLEDNVAGLPDSESGARFMLAGGVGIYNSRSPVMLNVGFAHVAIENGGTQIGLALVLGGR
jgi:hypothetical protein